MMVGIAEKALEGYAKTKTYEDPPESEPTKLQQELDGIFEAAREVDDDPG